MEEEALTQQIIGCAMQVHSALGPGFLESVYQQALTHELRKNGLAVKCGTHLDVLYDGINVGHFITDMIVAEKIIIENKAVQTLALAHEKQLVHYLTATGLDIGLLFNFGNHKLEFKRKHRLYRPKK